METERKAFLLLAEVGLVLTLFSDASRISLQVLKSNKKLPIRLLSTGMLLSILLGAIGAVVFLPQLSLWEACILAAILAPTDLREYGRAGCVPAVLLVLVSAGLHPRHGLSRHAPHVVQSRRS